MSEIIKLKTTVPYLYVEGHQFIGEYLNVTRSEAEKLKIYLQIKEVEEKIKEEKVEDYVKEVKQEVEDNGFEKLTVSELREIAKERNIEAYYSLKKQELIDVLKNK